MEIIDNVINPKIGEYYLVKCLLHKAELFPNDFIRKFPTQVQGNYRIMPVIGHLHEDKGHGLEEMHYHLDWRFIPEGILQHQQEAYKQLKWLKNTKNTHFYTPLTEKNIKGEPFFNKMKYLRHFRKFPERETFNNLAEKYKDCTMKNMVCPHKGTNLTSCIPVNNVVICPCHGLKWNIETGKLIL